MLSNKGLNKYINIQEQKVLIPVKTKVIKNNYFNSKVCLSSHYINNVPVNQRSKYSKFSEYLDLINELNLYVKQLAQRNIPGHDWIIETLETNAAGATLLCSNITTSKKNVVYYINGNKNSFKSLIISESKNLYTINCVIKLKVDKATYLKYNNDLAIRPYREGFDLDSRKECVLGLILAMKNNKFKEITINYQCLSKSLKPLITVQEQTNYTFKPMETSLMVSEQSLE